MLFGSSFLKTGMTSATFNASGKDFVEIDLLMQFVIGIKISFLARTLIVNVFFRTLICFNDHYGVTYLEFDGIVPN